MYIYIYTHYIHRLPKTSSSPLKIAHPKLKLIWTDHWFSGPETYVCFRGPGIYIYIHIRGGDPHHMGWRSTALCPEGRLLRQYVLFGSGAFQRERMQKTWTFLTSISWAQDRNFIPLGVWVAVGFFQELERWYVRILILQIIYSIYDMQIL